MAINLSMFFVRKKYVSQKKEIMIKIYMAPLPYCIYMDILWKFDGKWSIIFTKLFVKSYVE